MNASLGSLDSSPEVRHSGWVLHLLTSLQRGAEAWLRDGVEYILGHDESCDLVLWDESVAPRHLSLTAHRGQVRIQALEQPITLLTRSLAPGESVDVVAETSLRLGDVTLAVGSADTQWTILEIPEPRLVAVREVSATSEELSAPDITSQPGAVAAPLVDLDETASVSPTPAEQHDLDRVPLVGSWLRSARVSLLAAVLAIPLLAWLGWDVFGHPRAPQTASSLAAAQAAAIERLRKLAEEQGLGAIEILTRADGTGTMTLRGYCETRAKRDGLTDAAQAAGLRIDNRLWPEDVLRASLDESLERLGGGHLEYDYLGTGEVRVHGLLRPGISPGQLLRTLENDVPGIRQIALDVQELAPFLKELRDGLRVADLDQKLSIFSDEPPIAVTGRLKSRDMERWTNLREQLAARYPSLPSLVSNVERDPRERQQPNLGEQQPAPSESAEAAPEPAIRVRGILIGANKIAIAVLDTGEMVTRGDLIADRYQVEDVRLDRVIVLEGERRHILRVRSQ